MQSQAQAAAGLMMGASNPGGQLMGLGSPNPNGYRKRQPMNTAYSPGGFQHNGKGVAIFLSNFSYAKVCKRCCRKSKLKAVEKMSNTP